MTTELTPDSRYTVISADAHAGGDILDYRPYLANRWPNTDVFKAKTLPATTHACQTGLLNGKRCQP